MNELWSNYLFPFLTIFGLLILYFSLKNILPSYFSEKGKNLATKEDISDITELVETVKHSFTTETEKLKANLSMLTNVQVGLVAEERNAIIDYNEKYFKWLNILLDIHFGNADDNDNSDLDKHHRRLGDFYTDFINSETKFNLFVENPELVAYAQKMKLETLKQLSTLASKCVLNLKHNNINIELMKKSTPLEEQPKKYEELLKNKYNYYEEYREKMLAGYSVIAPMNKTFQQMCRDHIYQLIKQQEEKLK